MKNKYASLRSGILCTIRKNVVTNTNREILLYTRLISYSLGRQVGFLPLEHTSVEINVKVFGVNIICFTD